MGGRDTGMYHYCCMEIYHYCCMLGVVARVWDFNLVVFQDV